MREKPVLPDPTERDKAAMVAAAERAAQRPEPVEVATMPNSGGGVLAITAPHNDYAGFMVRLVEALGTSSDAFAMQSLGRMSSVVRSPGQDPTAAEVNGILAMMSAIAPANELETALGEQIVGAHTFAMEMLRQARKADTIPRLEAYSNIATKAQRTMAALVDALGKLRTGGKQQVEVRYVYVDARGSQNVISAGTPGGQIGNLGQSHATGVPDAVGAAVWGPDALGLPMPFAGGEEPAPLPDARRDEPGCTVGEGQRPISDGPVHPRAARGPRAGSRTRAVRAGER